MAKPPPTPPSSDIEGVDRDYRISLPSGQGEPDPGQQLVDAAEQSVGRPNEALPLDIESTGEENAARQSGTPEGGSAPRPDDPTSPAAASARQSGSDREMKERGFGDHKGGSI